MKISKVLHALSHCAVGFALTGRARNLSSSDWLKFSTNRSKASIQVVLEFFVSIRVPWFLFWFWMWKRCGLLKSNWGRQVSLSECPSFDDFALTSLKKVIEIVWINGDCLPVSFRNHLRHRQGDPLPQENRSHRNPQSRHSLGCLSPRTHISREGVYSVTQN